MIIPMSPALLEELSSSEKCVIDFINVHETKIPTLSINEIAEQTYTSSSTVSRAIQKAGFSGIAQLKFKISEPQQRNTPLAHEILAKCYRESVETIQHLSVSDIRKVVQAIQKSPRIFVFAKGLSTYCGMEFCHYLEILGYHAILVDDSVLLLNIKQRIQPTDLAIFLTLQNTSSEIAIAANQCQKVGTPIVVCCGKKDTVLYDLADWYFLVYTEKVIDDSYYPFFSRLPLSIFTRILIEFLYHATTSQPQPNRPKHSLSVR